MNAFTSFAPTVRRFTCLVDPLLKVAVTGAPPFSNANSPLIHTNPSMISVTSPYAFNVGAV